jgi:hypothetical protein
MENQMSVSMYRISIPVFLRGFAALSTYLDKAEAFAKEKGVDPHELVNARLAPDMLPLSGQYQRASDTAKFAVGRVTGIEMPKFEDNEQTIADLRQRLAKTEAFLATVSVEKLDASADRTLSITMAGTPVNVRGDEYLLGFALPNFYFHVATAHAILRHQGVAIGKRDYLGPLP